MIFIAGLSERSWMFCNAFEHLQIINYQLYLISQLSDYAVGKYVNAAAGNLTGGINRLSKPYWKRSAHKKYCQVRLHQGVNIGRSGSSWRAAGHDSPSGISPKVQLKVKDYISAHCLHLICVSPLLYLATGSTVALIVTPGRSPGPICLSVLSLNMSKVDTAPATGRDQFDDRRPSTEVINCKSHIDWASGADGERLAGTGGVMKPSRGEGYSQHICTSVSVSTGFYMKTNTFDTRFILKK